MIAVYILIYLAIGLPVSHAFRMRRYDQEDDIDPAQVLSWAFWPIFLWFLAATTSLAAILHLIEMCTGATVVDDKAQKLPSLVSMIGEVRDEWDYHLTEMWLLVLWWILLIPAVFLLMYGALRWVYKAVFRIPT